ncbi:NADPH-dependent FMN reductase [Bradyrhizobium australafricanum]|uniref:NADPH-dependent FMN reductase n=1 Tax=Bradyrhizobium australafricanum TaxID=2821406 RepID=UPI001CE294DF|nr:NAD(P)H-dependent oxidoreductase [Bradyrhizobium australafricanum]MCA6100084.1 NAD(P)H-dependent oxidoreductase [Bradyrhizobium australafricanum]
MQSPVLVIVGSVRPRRIAPQVAAWIATLGRHATSLSFELVDLSDWPLPMDDESATPNTGQYEHERTRAWSHKVAAAPAFVFVTPQYNGGYPAPLKNAIDHLYKEWAGKPAMIVCYGGHGGGKCAEQLVQVCRYVKMKPVAIRPALILPHEHIVANAGQIDPAAIFASQLAEVEQAFAQLKDALADDQGATET